MQCIIEYDGEHHFFPVAYDDNFEASVERFTDAARKDDIKNRYYLVNNILLMRIPYWEFENIENILTGYLEYVKKV